MFKWPWRKSQPRVSKVPRDPFLEEIDKLIILMGQNQNLNSKYVCLEGESYNVAYHLELPGLLLFRSGFTICLCGDFKNMSEDLQTIAYEIADEARDLLVVDFDPSAESWPVIARVSQNDSTITYGRGDTEVQKEVFKLAVAAALKHYRVLEDSKVANNAHYDELRNSFVRRLGEGLRAEQGE